MRYLLALFLFGLCVSTPLKAAEFCEDCTPEQMFAVGQNAVRKVAWNRPHPPIYVTNFANGIIIKVGYANNVGPGFDWEYDLFEHWGVSMPVEPQALAYMAEMHATLPAPIVLSASTAVAAKGITTAQAEDIPQSAYEAISTPRYDYIVSNAISGTAAGYRQRAIDLLKANNPIPNLNPQALMPAVRVIFADGTFAFYEWDITLQIWKRKAARDRFGNPIPEDVNAVAGDGGAMNYEFSGGASTELAQFLYRLRDLGVSVTNAGGSGTRTRVACTSANKGTPVCRIVIY